MRTAIKAGIVVFVLTLVAVATTGEGAFILVFGWIPFLGRVVPEVRPDGPSVAVGGIALLLFAAGVHALGRSFRGSAGWRLRWTAAVVLGVTLLFTAGIAVIGITHNVAWLATSEQPMRSEGLKWRSSAINQAKMISIGLFGYESANSRLPPGGTFSDTGEMRHSWETHLLPFLGYWPRDIDMNRPWNGPENEKYFKCVLPNFINPGFRTQALEDDHKFGLSHYAANSRVMSANKSMKLAEITKGAAETILVGEVNAGFKPWGHPLNFRDPADGLTGGPKTFGGPPGSGGANFVMADGSVRFLANNADPAVLRALSDPRAER